MKIPASVVKFIRKTFLYTLLLSLCAGFQTTAMAGVVGNDQLSVESELQIKRDEVATFIAREDVRAALVKAGVSEADVNTRVQNLTDAQVLQIHKQMSDLPAGGDGALGIIIAIIVIFMLLDLAGVTDIFPGI